MDSAAAVVDSVPEEMAVLLLPNIVVEGLCLVEECYCYWGPPSNFAVSNCSIWINRTATEPNEFQSILTPGRLPFTIILAHGHGKL